MKQWIKSTNLVTGMKYLSTDETILLLHTYIALILREIKVVTCILMIQSVQWESMSITNRTKKE